MSRWGWHGAFTCRQPSIPTIGYYSVGPGWWHWGSVSPFSFAGCVALEPPDSCSSTGYPITASVWLCFLESGAPCPPLPQTCASSSSGEALAKLQPALYYSVCTLKALKRAPGRPRTGNRCMRFTILSLSLRLPYRRGSLFPVNLHMDPGWTPRLGKSIILVEHTPRNWHWRVGRHRSSDGSSESNSCSSTTDFLLHVLLQTRCYSGKLRCRTDSRRSACTVSVALPRRLIKLHPAGPLVPQAAAKLRPRWNKSSAAGIAQGPLQRLVSSHADNMV